jgi:chitin synthase
MQSTPFPPSQSQDLRHQQEQPPPQIPADYLTPHARFSSFDNSQPAPRPQSQFGLDYEMVEREDLGDMPLLRHNGSYAAAPMPGSYLETDDRSETNIRYGHIPQRVPRRYKTIKKVE